MIAEDKINQIIQILKNLYDYDFENYSKASLSRRINSFYNAKSITEDELKYRVLNDKNFAIELVHYITINVTEFFRDPHFYLSLEKNCFDYLKTYFNLRIWVAGCSTGEEAYSLAILLERNQLLKNSIIYGTDINTDVIEFAKKGVYPIDDFNSPHKNFENVNLNLKSFLSNENQIVISSKMKKNIYFAKHNLGNDKSFNSFQIISCRNTLIYFNEDLQKKVFGLFDESLEIHGFLCLGSAENLWVPEIKKKYKVIDSANRIYQKTSL